MTARAPTCVLLAIACVAGFAAPMRAQGPAPEGRAETGAASRPAPAELLAPRNRAVADVVGFRSFVVHDPARAYDPDAYDPDAHEPEARSRPPHRPIRLAVWYPASGPTTAPLTAADYRRLADPERALADWAPEEVLAFEDSLAAALEADGVDPATVRARVDAPAEALWDAPPAEGRSPLVLYLPDADESIGESAAAFERLAARGAIVAALPALGPAPGLELEDEAGLETRVRDAAFALGFLLDERAASIGGVAVVGRGRGASAAAALAARRPEVDALVVLGGSASALEALPDFDPVRLTTPTLEVGDGPRGDGVGEAVRFAPVASVRAPGAPARLEGSVVDAVAAFVEAGVEPVVEGAAGPAGATRTAGLDPPPDVAALVRLYRAGRGAEAEAAVLAARRAVPGAYRAPALAAVGEILLDLDPSAAVAALSLAARLHPGSSRVARLLADARERAPTDLGALPADSVGGRR